MHTPRALLVLLLKIASASANVKVPPHLFWERSEQTCICMKHPSELAPGQPPRCENWGGSLSSPPPASPESIPPPVDRITADGMRRKIPTPGGRKPCRLDIKPCLSFHETPHAAGLLPLLPATQLPPIHHAEAGPIEESKKAMKCNSGRTLAA